MNWFELELRMQEHGTGAGYRAVWMKMSGAQLYRQTVVFALSGLLF